MGLLRRILDSNKRVQEASCSAFATLEEVSTAIPRIDVCLTFPAGLMHMNLFVLLAGGCRRTGTTLGNHFAASFVCLWKISGLYTSPLYQTFISCLTICLVEFESSDHHRFACQWFFLFLAFYYCLFLLLETQPPNCIWCNWYSSGRSWSGA